MPSASLRTVIAVNAGARDRRSTLPQFSILEAPSILGLSPTGVESLPEALLAAGLRTGLQKRNPLEGSFLRRTPRNEMSEH